MTAVSRDRALCASAPLPNPGKMLDSAGRRSERALHRYRNNASIGWK